LGYLFGDATESSLDSNYLEFLKAAVEFCVGVLESTDTIAALQIETQKRKRGATVEREQLQRVARDIETTLQNCLSKADAPITNKCVHQVRGLSRGEIERSKGAIETGLEGELSRIDKEIRRQRVSNHARLETLLLEHDLPHSRQWIDYRAAPDGSATADLVGTAASQLSWSIELDVPPDHALHEPLRIDRLFPQFTIEVPEMAGWVRKRIKLKTYKLTKDYIVALQHRDGRAVLELRSNPSERDSGFDITYVGGMPRQIVRLHKGTASDPCEPEPGDVERLQELLRAVSKSLSELRMNRRSLKSARLDDKALDRHKEPAVLVDRLVGQMVPVVAEISAHSLSPTELVLKRVLADDQRVEIFASKADLQAKVETLSPDSRRVFIPLELDKPNPVPGSVIPPAVRSAPAIPVLPPTPLPSDAVAEPGGSQPGGSQPGGSGPGDDEPVASDPAPSEPEEAAPASLPSLIDDDSIDSPVISSQPIATLNLAQLPARRASTRNTNPGMGPKAEVGEVAEISASDGELEIIDESTQVMDQEVADMLEAQMGDADADADADAEDDLPPTVQRQAPVLPRPPGSAPGRKAPPLPKPSRPPRRGPPPPPPQRPPADSATSVEINVEDLGD
jgi:hypothetical protein